ncbi:hypothetical protein FAIPA1_120135 [Frankia sp. AiPs1]
MMARAGWDGVVPPKGLWPVRAGMDRANQGLWPVRAGMARLWAPPAVTVVDGLLALLDRRAVASRPLP